MATQEGAEFFRDYPLRECRKGADPQEPEPHQAEALGRLGDWFRDRPRPHAGGILVLPTGAGKTFTAMRFLARHPLSSGYKVLWLAHTHHLLEQAFYGLKDHTACISESLDHLRVRVVSGTPGHLPVHSVKASDDFVIATLPTIARALRDRHPSLLAFLNSAQERLLVVFDEAHHAPAPSYRWLVQELRNRHADMVLLGLTATPHYENESRSGWLGELFPQQILYEVSAARLMAANVLARPVVEEPHTRMSFEFDEREYQKWLGTNLDIPEHIISTLALNQERNAFIAQTYLDNKEKYGKTIVFADRWYQCEVLREYLLKRGVRADAVYSHIDAEPCSVEARARRAKDENAKVLEAFRKNELDVLINVRMLTEGTDVPDVQSVFLTRQTTSRVLLTQMVGRALRGPKFGGTQSAYVVSFIDNWRQLVNWATYDQLAAGGLDPSLPEYGRRPPLQVISIELVRRLARSMDSGVNVETFPFVQLLPVGWYRVDYLAAVAGTDDHSQVQRLVLVFDLEEASYRRFLEHAAGQPLGLYAAEDVDVREILEGLAPWRDRFFTDQPAHVASDLDRDLVALIRHVAQNGGLPKFFRFEEREQHDLDHLATQAIEKDWSLQQVATAAASEYNRPDRFWATLYPTLAMFKSQLDSCVNRMVLGDKCVPGEQPPWTNPELRPEREPSDEIKKQVRERDGGCLCCGETRSQTLHVDHVNPWRFGGSNLVDNLQTLCAICNGLKADTYISFRDPQSDLATPPAGLPPVRLPAGGGIRDRDQWAKYIRRMVNFFYRCGAVQKVDIKQRGTAADRWTVTLFAGNEPGWLAPHLAGLLDNIRSVRQAMGFSTPSEIVVEAPDAQPAVASVAGNAAAPEQMPAVPRVADSTKEAPSKPQGRRLTKRDVLECLTVTRLRELAAWAVDVDSAGLRLKGDFVDALVRSRYYSLAEYCDALMVEELRQLCDLLEVRPRSRRTKADLIAALTGK